MLQKNGAEIVSNMIGNEVQTFMDTPITKLLEGKDNQIKQIVNTVESVYRTIISEHLPRILESVDIAKIVRERIIEMDVNETEKEILHLRTIVSTFEDSLKDFDEKQSEKLLQKYNDADGKVKNVKL